MCSLVLTKIEMIYVFYGRKQELKTLEKEYLKKNSLCYIWSKKNTLIGRQTSGGSCIVLNCSTLFAGIFSLSSSVRMYGYKNGAPVDVEFGVDPDILLDTEMEFYDRGSTSTLGKLFS